MRRWPGGLRNSAVRISDAGQRFDAVVQLISSSAYMMPAAGWVKDQLARAVDRSPTCPEAHFGYAILKASRFLIARSDGKGAIGINVAPPAVPFYSGKSLREV